MDRADVRRHIEATCPGIAVLEDAGSWFFVLPGAHNPHQIPFATLTVSDRYDPGSDLERRGLWRLNLGIGVAAYAERFGKPPTFPKDGGIVPGHDYARRDVLMPHPIYAAMGWVCVVDPSPATFEALKPLVAQAYAQAQPPRTS